MGLREVQLAALLHDIGKFAWRGGESGSHEELSANFCRRYLPEKLQEGIIGLVSGHGDPSKYLSPEFYPLKIVVLADWLSVAEREERKAGEKGKPKEEPLISIFSKIDIKKGEPPQEMYYFPRELSLNRENVFPTRDTDKKTLTGEYDTLWKHFIKEVEGVQKLSEFDSYFNTLYFLLQKYTWAIPSAAYVHKPDISLFDHLKTSCAIATSLAPLDEGKIDVLIKALHRRWGVEESLKKKGIEDKELDKKVEEIFNKEAPENEKEALNEEDFLLIGGDISGIQNFIYNISSKGAAKSLKGRSFYLQLLTDTIASYMLKKLGLPITNLLLSGGGHFYILAPKSSEPALVELRKEAVSILFESHKGELHLILEWAPLSALDFNNFTVKWNETSMQLASAKRRKFSEIIDEKYEDIFNTDEGREDVCEMCSSEKNVVIDEDKKKCKFCKSFEGLAEHLKKANYIIEIYKGEEEGGLEEDSWKYVLHRFGFEYKFEEKLPKIGTEKIVIYTLNSTKFPADASPSASCGFRFLAKKTPLLPDGKIKSFDDFAEKSRGVKKWGVLRMDIDDLGRIFSEGLGRDRSISRVSTLSSLLSFYFSAIVENIVSKYENAYVIYSGGDDLFITSSWDVLPEIAREIYEKFRDFTCRNDNITLSGGIYIAPSRKYPLYKSADLAGDALDENAKGLPEKNGLSFLDRGLKWSEFSEKVVPFKDSILDLINGKNGEKKIPRALLQKLYIIYNEYETKKKRYGKTSAKYDDRYGRWKWFSAYLFAAMIRQYKERSKDLEALYSQVRNNIEYVPIATRWAELLTRKEEERYEQ